MSTVAVAIAGLCLAPAAGAAGPSCGDTINHDVKLKHNLDCSAANSDGLDIGKSGVTLDLNGHTIKGPGGAAGTYSGVYSEKDRVTVENGTIKNYNYGVYLYGPARPLVTHVEVDSDGASNNYYGIYTYYVTGGLFTHNLVKEPDEGIYLNDGSNNLVTRNRVVRTTYGIDIENEYGTQSIGNVSVGKPGTTYGMYDYENDHVLWRGNTANDGIDGVYSEYPTKVTFDRQVANGNDSYGFYISLNDPASNYFAKVTNSTANHNDVGIYAEHHVGGGNNTALHNSDYDCYQASCNG